MKNYGHYLLRIQNMTDFSVLRNIILTTSAYAFVVRVLITSVGDNAMCVNEKCDKK